jgi:hypothetical protein
VASVGVSITATCWHGFSVSCAQGCVRKCLCETEPVGVFATPESEKNAALRDLTALFRAFGSAL